MSSVSDDPDDQENGMMFVGGSPQEIIKHQQEMQDKANASAQELRASVDRMVDEMPAEHAYTLLRLFEYIAHGDASAIHFFVGQLSAVLRVVHHACMTCGSTQHTTSLHGLEMKRTIPEPEANPTGHPHDDHIFQKYPLDCERCAMESADKSFERASEEEWPD